MTPESRNCDTKDTMKKIALAALALLACEGPTEDTLAQLAGDAGELLQDAAQVLADASQALHDASTADAQVQDASMDKPKRQTLETACDQVRTVTESAGGVPGTSNWAVFDVSPEDVRTAWVCEPPANADQLACQKGATCAGPVPTKSKCSAANLIEAEDGRLWVPCAGYKSAKLVTD